MKPVVPSLVLVMVAACGGSGATSQRVNYPDGSAHYEYELRDGLPNGIGRVWHQNGELKSTGEYVNGVKHGIFTFFDDDGAFAHQAYFFKGAEVWRSTERSAKPPPELVKGLVAFSGSAPQLGRDEYTRPPPPSEEWSVELSRDPPAPYFATLDRTTSLSRVGLQFGFGDASDRPIGAVNRLDLFVNYRFSHFGIYGQLMQSNFEAAPGMTLSGRRTAEVSGTYHASLAGIGALSLRAGVLVPIGNDDTDGYIAGTAGSFHRPTDAAASVPSSVALRTGSSFARSYSRLIVQADAGVDWLLGGQAAFDALLRANAGAGVGMRSALLSVELSNALRVTEPTRRIHTLGVGGTFWMEQLWLTLFASSSFEGNIALTGSVGYEL